MTDTCTNRAFVAFSELTPAIGEVTNVEELLHMVARRISALVGVERCSVFLRDEREEVFRGYVSRNGKGIDDEQIRHCRAGIPADGLTRETLRTRRPVIVENARADARMVRETVRRWKIRSVMSVPMLLGAEVIGLILLDDVDRRHAFSEEEANLAQGFAELAAMAVRQTQVRLELSSKLEVAGRQLHALRRATAVDEQLTDLVLEGRSLEDLMGSLARLLGKPCAVFLPAGERRATALPDGASEGAVPRLLDPEFAGDADIQQALAEHEGSRAFVVGPLPRAGILHRHVVAPVTIGGETWGRLVVMEHKARFTGGDVVAVRRAATLIALQVSAERKAVEADWNAGSSLAAELLGGCSDAATVRRRADRLGVDLEAPRLVMLIGSRSGDEEDAPDFRAVADAFRRLAPWLTVQVTAVNGAVAALVEVPAKASPERFAAESRALFESIRASLHPARQLIAGISTIYRDREGYRSAHREARQVVECIRRFSPLDGPALFSADELGVGSLLLSSSDGQAVGSFAEQTVGRLLSEHSKADLLTTLCSFFENMGSIRGAAAALDVHENTIRYRLSRIEELTGLAVMHDPDAQLRARLSLFVLLLQGRLPSGVGAPPAQVPGPRLEVVDAAVS